MAAAATPLLAAYRHTLAPRPPSSTSGHMPLPSTQRWTLHPPPPARWLGYTASHPSSQYNDSKGLEKPCFKQISWKPWVHAIEA